MRPGAILLGECPSPLDPPLLGLDRGRRSARKWPKRGDAQHSRPPFGGPNRFSVAGHLSLDLLASWGLMDQPLMLRATRMRGVGIR